MTSYLHRIVIFARLVGLTAGYLVRRSWYWVMGYHADEGATLLGRYVSEGLTRLGPLFVKLGQLVSAHRFWFRESFIRELGRLQDHVTPMSEAELEEVLSGYDVTKFGHFDRIPVASGSVAQVHSARLRDGTRVAVKVLRPHIRRDLQTNVAVVRWLVNLLSLVPSFGIFRLREHFCKVSDLLLMQTDFRRETNDLEEFARRHRHNKFIHIPKVHLDMCTSDVIVMEYIDGDRLTEIPDDIRPPPEELSRRILGFVVRSVYLDGYFHCDLHPGNLLFRRSDRKICILDFGITSRYDKGFVALYSSLWRRITHKEWDLASDEFLRIFPEDPEVMVRALEDPSRGPELRHRVRTLLRTHFDDENKWDLVPCLRDTETLLSEYGTHVSMRLNDINVAIASVEGTNATIGSGIGMRIIHELSRA